jgi:uncharacterized protein YajQ (UPF0234 family)
MASFDIVSKLDMGEFKNALSQAEKEVNNRYDFKGSNTGYELKESAKTLEILGSNEYQVKAAMEILRGKLATRGLSQKTLEPGEIEPTGNRMYKMIVSLKSGIDKENGKLVNKLIKESGIKVTSAYMDEKVRVTGKQIDDLQSVWALLKENEEVKVPLQMENMKR